MSISSSSSSRRSDTSDPSPDRDWDPSDGFPFHPLANGPNFLPPSLPKRRRLLEHASTGGKRQLPHVFKVAVPGPRKEELRVEIEDGRVLQISGERSEEKPSGNSWHVMERSGSMFSWWFWLPKNAKVEELKATIENGVLTVTATTEEKKGNIEVLLDFWLKQLSGPNLDFKYVPVPRSI